MKFKIIFIFFLVASVIAKSQNDNVLSGVYVVVHKVIGNDTIYSFINGKVIDSLSHKPVKGASVNLFTSRGDALDAKTDSLGNFKINQLPTANHHPTGS